MVFPTRQCAFRIRVLALASVRPTTCGTVHVGRTGGGAGGGGGGGGSPVHSGYAKLAIRVRQSNELVLA